MKVTIETISAVEKKLNFEIPPERVSKELEKVYHSFQHSARIKGFRPGKAPRALIERQFGDQVASEVRAHLVEESYAEALKEHQLPVVTQPHIVPEHLTAGQPFRYAATVEVRPEITVTDFEGIEVEKQVRRVQESDVESSLQRLAESLAQLHPIVDRNEVGPGDMVRLDFSASVNGKPAPGLEGKGRLIEMGKESIFPGFQNQLLGAKKGSAVGFSLPFPEEPGEQEKETAPVPARTADFRVVVQDLLRKEIPLLDDEFAKDHGECDTLEELRGKVRQNLQLSLDRQDEGRLEDEILSQLITRNPFEVPPSLVREQERRMLVDAGLLRPDEELSTSRLALPEQFREEFSARARRQVQSFLLLEALGKQQNIQVAEEEIQQRIADIVAANGVERRQQIEALYERPENRQSLEHRLQQEKTLRLVVEKAQIQTVEKRDAVAEAGVAGVEEKD